MTIPLPLKSRHHLLGIINIKWWLRETYAKIRFNSVSQDYWPRKKLIRAIFRGGDHCVYLASWFADLCGLEGRRWHRSQQGSRSLLRFCIWDVRVHCCQISAWAIMYKLLCHTWWKGQSITKIIFWRQLQLIYADCSPSIYLQEIKCIA